MGKIICTQCHKSFVKKPGAGRPPRFCSSKCNQLDWNTRNARRAKANCHRYYLKNKAKIRAKNALWQAANLARYRFLQRRWGRSNFAVKREYYLKAKAKPGYLEKRRAAARLWSKRWCSIPKNKARKSKTYRSWYLRSRYGEFGRAVIELRKLEKLLRENK